VTDIPLSDSYTKFCDLLTLADEYFAVGDLSTSVRLAQIAARFAYPGHVGLFGSPRLEQLLLKLGKQIPSTSACGVRRRNGFSRDVLHVLSYAQPIGGDSRFAWRWMQEDRSSRHSVAITSQADLNGKYDIPEMMLKATEDSGGFLRTLSAPTSQPLDQARELRALCQEADVIVLHLYPYDIVPVLALAEGCNDAKTLLINHADHTFWVGAGVAHSVVHLRRQYPDFLKNRRGINPDQSPILPVPLAYFPQSVNQAQAKIALGYEPDTLILLTIATPFKYWAPNSISFLDLVSPILSKDTRAVLIAVGPEPVGTWQSASIQTNGRIVPLGKRWDNDLLYAAADIYLDSVPFSSTTSLLEAGSRGIPLLGYSSPNPDLRLLGPGAPGLDNAMEVANDVGSYRTLLTRLIADEDFRRRSGQSVKNQILSLHTGNQWVHTVDELYTKVESINERGCFQQSNDTFQESELNLALLHLYGRKPFGGLRTLMRQYLGTLPYPARLSATWRLYRKGFDLSLANLLPPPLDLVVRGVRRWAKKIVGRFTRTR
jgi:hypothetical protein